MNIRRFNWQIWTGFLLSVISFLSYYLVFIWFPVTRDFPWATLVLFGISSALLLVGVRRTYAARGRKRFRVLATIATTLGLAICTLFLLLFFVVGRRLPASHGAPQVGQVAPGFTLADTNNKPVALSELLASPLNGRTPRGVLLIFYRGYW